MTAQRALTAALFEPDSGLAHEVRPSPNTGDRRGGLHPTMLLLHYTGMASAAKAVDWLANPKSGVSCHYVIDERGRITQMVPEARRAWHAGVASWAGETDINSASIGIEIQNPGHADGYHDFPRLQMRAARDLAADIQARHVIKPERILAHSDVAPFRKIDPGEKFDWGWLAKAGVGHWVRPSPLRMSAGRGLAHGKAAELARALLSAYGYGVAEGDAGLAVVVAAFQRHFRPGRIDGVIDASTLHTLERLVMALSATGTRQ
jgi:N-acetylmuramoyl-L-alanine amidase